MALLVLGSGITGAIYAVCPATIGEFTRRPFHLWSDLRPGGVLAPFVMGSVIGAATQFMTGFKIKAAILIASGMLGLLLLWPGADKERVFRVAT